VLHVPRKTLYDKLTRFCVDPSTFRAESADNAFEAAAAASFAPGMH